MRLLRGRLLIEIRWLSRYDSLDALTRDELDKAYQGAKAEALSPDAYVTKDGGVYRYRESNIDWTGPYIP